jgi:uncharacterized membrane protein
MSKRHRNRNPVPQDRQPTVVTQATTQWSGPLPPPEALQKFEAVIPGGAERILAMAELEQKHRVGREGVALNAMIADTRRGQWLGGAVAIAAIAGAVGTAYAGVYWVVPASLVSVPVMAMIRALIVARGAGPTERQTP